MKHGMRLFSRNASMSNLRSSRSQAARLTLSTLSVVLLLTACGATTAPSPGTPSPTTTTTLLPTMTTSLPEMTTTSTPGEPVLLLPSASGFGSDWAEVLFIPYGEGEEELGTAPGGDGGGLDLGPEYGAQGPDGSWWILDAAKRRLAHYSETGEYLDAVPMKPEHLTQGQYFQFQLPHILADGTLVAQRLGGGNTTLLLLQDGDTRLVSVPTDFGIRFDNGTSLYGFSGEGRLLTRVDAYTGDLEEVDWFETRSGSRFRLQVHGDRLTVEFPDAPEAASLSWRLAYADDPTIPAYGMVEVSSGGDGTLFLYILGGTDSGVGGQLAGFLSISPDGVASPVEPTRDPFTPSDPGSPAHLGIRAGDGAPWIMIVDTDGVRVYARS